MSGYKKLFDSEKILKELNKSNINVYINKKEYEYGNYFIPENEGIYDIKLKFKIKLKDCSYMFAECENIINIDFTLFNSDNVKNMKCMFYNCKNLKNINLFSFNTLSVENMDDIFYGCNKKNKIDLSSFNIKNKSNKITNENLNKNHINSKYDFEIINDYYKEPNEENIKDRYKILFLGGSGIGAKTSLINQIVYNKFLGDYDYNSSISYLYEQFKVKLLELKNGRKIKLDLWDTAGHELYRNLIKFYIKDTDCIILGFDITHKGSFDEIKEFFLPFVKKISDVKLIYLIGNKIDLYEEREVEKKEAIDFSKKNNLRYFETSCKTRDGIQNFIEDLSNEIIKT